MSPQGRRLLSLRLRYRGPIRDRADPCYTLWLSLHSCPFPSQRTAAGRARSRALIEMYLAGVSVRRVEDITEALWGTRVSPSTVSNLNKKIYAKIELGGTAASRRASVPLSRRHRDERTWAGEVRNVSLLVASAVIPRISGDSGHCEAPRRTVGLVGVPAAPGRSWAQGRAAHHLRRLRGLMESAAEYLPDARISSLYVS